MQVAVETVAGLERRMTVSVPADQVNQAVDQRLQSLARTVRMDGFRPGKVPLRVVRQRFGAQARQEVFGELIRTTFYEAAEQEKLKPAGEPAVEIRDEADGGLGYTATFEVMPEIEPLPLDDVTIKRPQAAVEEADVDAMIEKLRKQRTTWNPVEREAQGGDRLDISFQGSVDGEPFEGGRADHVALVIGSGAMIEGFESGLVGAQPEETRKLDLQFPDGYRAEQLAGKPVRFEVTVHAVAEPQLPEVDEAFARLFGVDDGSIEQLRSDIRDNMSRELEQKVSSLLKERVMDALLAKNALDVPAVLISQEAERMKQQAMEEMRRSGQSGNLDLPTDIFSGQAERRVKLGLLVGEIIRRNAISADAERVRQTVERFAESYENPEEVINYYLSDQQQRAAVENLVLEDQVVDWILEQARVEDEPTSFDSLMGN